MIIGIIGKTNSGKSTFFKACTLLDVEIANRPFVTIDLNHGVGFVKVECAEREFNVKCDAQNGFCIEGNRFIPVELYDVAGLIPGAYKGYGLGLKFLNDLSSADALIHVVDISGSTNEKGEVVEKLSYDPANDIRFLEKEINMWFYSLISKDIDILKGKIKSGKLDLKQALFKKFSGLKITEKHINEVLEEIDKAFINWNEDDVKKFSMLLRKKSKPIIIAANKIDVNGSEKNLERLKKEFKDYIIIGCSSESELALKEAAKNKLIYYVPGEKNFEVIGEVSKKQKKGLSFIESFLEKRNTGVQDVLNKAVFDLLNYIVVYPVENNKLADSKGNILPDAILLPKGSTVLDLAYKVHSDLAKNFIKAINLKTKKIIGKDYILKNNDVIEIITK